DLPRTALDEVGPVVLDAGDVFEEAAQAQRAGGGRQPGLLVGDAGHRLLEQPAVLGQRLQQIAALGVQVVVRPDCHAPIMATHTGHRPAGFLEGVLTSVCRTVGAYETPDGAQLGAPASVVDHHATDL